MDKNNSGSECGRFASLLTVTFITLKLVGVIDWSWFWVISPAVFAVALPLLVLGAIALWAKFI